MPTWSTRTALFLAACAPALGASSLFTATAGAQVSAANTIAPANTVVAPPLPTVKPTPAPVTATARSVSSPTTAKPKKSRSVRPTAAAPALTNTLGVGAPVATDPVDTTVAVADPSAGMAPVEAVSFSDPLADLASAALLVLPSGQVGRAGQTGVVTATGQSKSSPLVVTAAPAAPRIQFAVTPPSIDPSVDPNTPKPPTSMGSSSVIINTSDLAEYVLGTAIAAPVSKESQAVIAALPTVGSDRYLALLGAMAKLVGPRTKTDPAALEAVWSRTDQARMKAILTAMAQVGTRYHFTGNKPGGFDCSGLTSYAWSQAGVKIPRTSSLQYEGLPRKAAGDLLPGDIVWHPGHVSMYLGVDQAVVDAPQTGKTVLVKKASPSSFVSFLNPF